MKLESVTISGFRGYADEQTIDIGDLTTIVGKNDSGKSSVLEALAVFFGNDVVKIDSSDCHVGSESRQITVSCTFSDIPTSIVLDANAETSLGDEHLLTPEGRLCIKKQWDCKGVKPKEEIFVVASHPSAANYSDLLQLTNAQLKTRFKALELPDAEVNKASNPSLRAAIWDSCDDLELKVQDVPLGKEDGKRTWDRIAAIMPHFALFQSDRSSRDSDNEVQDPMKLAVAAALAEVEVQEALATVVDAVRIRATELAERTHQALGELDPDLADGLLPKFRSDPKWASLFSVALDGVDGIAINKRGSGVRRLILVSFFRAEARRQAEAGSKRSVIYAIEEPETSQHPRNQKILLDSFREMAANEGCQVLLTTHSPGVAGSLPTETLRFVRKAKNESPEILRSSPEVWAMIADELGVLPDDRVKVLICVEGPNDVLALRALSRALHEEDPSFVDFQVDHRIAFVPLGGGTLTQWVSERYLRGFGRPEVHLYDNDVAKYGDAVEKVNARGDGSWASLTGMREMENYLHPSVVSQVMGVSVTYSATDDVPALISAAITADPSRRPLNAKNVKSKLAEHAFPAMTAELLDEADPNGDIRGWMVRVSQDVNS